MEWIDSDGFLHVYPNPDLEGSENGPLFTAEYHLLCKLLHLDLPKYPNIDSLNKDGVWYTTSVSNRERISHDNCTGIYILNFLHNKNISNLPIIDWGRGMFKDVSHPRDIAFYSIMKENIWSKFLLVPFLLLLLVSSLVSCSREAGITSGKMLWWTRWNALKLHRSSIVRVCAKIGFKMATLLINKINGGWAGVSAIYFKEEDHPINVLMRKLYE